jgi:hypothetical protein
MPEGVVCLALAGGLQVSTVRMDKVFRDPGPSTASVPAMPVPDIADRRHRSARHQAADAGVVPRHAYGQGKKGISNIELGRRLGISTNAAWRLQHKLMQAMLERDRRYKLGAAGPRIEIDDAYIGGERTGEGSGRGRRGHTPFIVAIETSDDGRPLHARVQVVRGFRAGETKRLCSGVETGTTVVSDGGQWFRCIAEQPGIVHERHVTGSDRRVARHPAFRWRTRCWPMSRTASWPRIAWSAPNICHVTSALSPGASTAALF